MKKFRSLAQQNAHHIAVLNGEMGHVKENVSEIKEKTKCVPSMKTDIIWIKRGLIGIITLLVGIGLRLLGLS